MADETGSERETKKTVVYEQRSSETSKSFILPLVIVGIIVIALVVFILMRIS